MLGRYIATDVFIDGGPIYSSPADRLYFEPLGNTAGMIPGADIKKEDIKNASPVELNRFLKTRLVLQLSQLQKPDLVDLAIMHANMSEKKKF